jgi:hypothetical protein
LQHCSVPFKTATVQRAFAHLYKSASAGAIPLRCPVVGRLFARVPRRSQSGRCSRRDWSAAPLWRDAQRLGLRSINGKNHQLLGHRTVTQALRKAAHTAVARPSGGSLLFISKIPLENFRQNKHFRLKFLLGEPYSVFRSMKTSIITIVVAALFTISPPMVSARARSVLTANASSQTIQNARADAYHLTRMRNRAMIVQFAEAGYLVSVRSRTRYYYLHRVPSAYRYLRPWTKRFLDQISKDYYANFHQRLRVTSLVRTVEMQRRLAHRNSNAADATGDDRSSHLTGATLDISKHSMSWREKKWLRHELIELQKSGYLYAVEEFHQPCFHVMVYPNYRDYAPNRASQSLEADRTN